MQAKIYKITNDINNKVYVGQTYRSIEDRFKRHCAEARWKNMKKMPIVLAIAKYGHQHFSIHLLETIAMDSAQSLVDEREVHWGRTLDTLSPNGYNLKLGAGSGCMSEETKKKIALSNTGKYVSEETREKLRKSHLGYKVKQSTKDKLSAYFKGRPLHPNTIKAKNKPRKYILISPEGIITPIYGMKTFAKRMNLQHTNLSELVTGKITQYKGWTLPLAPVVPS